MRKYRKLFLIPLFFPAIVIVYLLIAWVTSYIPVSGDFSQKTKEHTIYINTNGVHIDIIFPVSTLETKYQQQLNATDSLSFVSLGWGDKNFYINTPTWGDLTASTAFHALFLKSESLMHVTTYLSKQKSWIEVKLNAQQLRSLQEHAFGSFKTNEEGAFNNIGCGYGYNDTFYEAIGSYSCFKTCNTWVNQGLKKAKIKTALWTPFDFGILHHIQ